MQEIQVSSDNLEHIAREAGHRWGLRLAEQYAKRQESKGNWPGTLEEARRTVDSFASRKISHDDRELLALLVERAARRAWHSQAR